MIEVSQDSALSAINFALIAEDGINFLRLWNEGAFDVIRREWPEVPDSVFIGADSLFESSSNNYGN